MVNIRDRTVEFKQSVNTYTKLNKQQTQQPAAQVSKSEFSQRASVIAKDITHTTELLSKLALLAKRKPMFDDKPVEIAELTYIIKQDIVKIEKSLIGLQQYQRTGVATGDGASQVSAHSRNVVTMLNTKMKNISGDFKSVLEARQRLERQNRERLDKLTEDISQRQASQHNLLDKGYASENPFMADDTAHSGVLSLPQQQQMLIREQDQQYLQQRNQAVEQIESTIQEVGNLFQQLATMVNEQGEQIQRIDANVEDIDLNIAGAQRELLKYFDRVSSNRWMALKIFAVLFVFFLVWVMVN